MIAPPAFPAPTPSFPLRAHRSDQSLHYHRRSIYHCMTRTVNGAFLLDDPAKEVLRKQLWQIAGYCGLRVLTYAIMANHFHVLVRVPKATSLSGKN